MFFFLVSVSFHFVAFLATMALRPQLVVSVDDIGEGSRDVAFDQHEFPGSRSSLRQIN
jgi:hypothetical protein